MYVCRRPSKCHQSIWFSRLVSFRKTYGVCPAVSGIGWHEVSCVCSVKGAEPSTCFTWIYWWQEILRVLFVLVVKRKSHRFFQEILDWLISSGVHIVVLTVSCDYTDRPPYPRVIRSKAYHGYVKVRIITDATYNVN